MTSIIPFSGTGPEGTVVSGSLSVPLRRTSAGVLVPADVRDVDEDLHDSINAGRRTEIYRKKWRSKEEKHRRFGSGDGDINIDESDEVVDFDDDNNDNHARLNDLESNLDDLDNDNNDLEGSGSSNSGDADAYDNFSYLGNDLLMPARDAVTRYTELRFSREAGGMTLLELSPETIKLPDQLLAHAAYGLKTPILGDYVYCKAAQRMHQKEGEGISLPRHLYR
jgi:hypothetical protein